MEIVVKMIPLSINETKKLIEIDSNNIKYNNKPVIIHKEIKEYLQSCEEASYLLDFIGYYILVPQTNIRRVIHEQLLHLC